MMLLTIVLVWGATALAFMEQGQAVPEEESCSVAEFGSYRLPFFVLIFFAGALLNCKEFLGIPSC